MTAVNPIAQSKFQECPTPHKAAYDRISAALKAADAVTPRRDLHPYRCPCGRYHLTSNGGRSDHRRRAGQIRLTDEEFKDRLASFGVHETTLPDGTVGYLREDIERIMAILEDL